MKTYHLFLTLVLTMSTPAADAAADPIWRWVDANGRVTFSNIKPPGPVRNVTIIESRWAADESRRPSAAGQNGPPGPEHHPWRDAYDMLLEEIDDLQEYVDDLRSDLSATRYVLYTPEADYAYSRRYDWAPRRHPPRQRDHYGQRRYDRSYFSRSYRYRSTLPQFGSDRAPSTRTPKQHRDSGPALKR